MLFAILQRTYDWLYKLYVEAECHYIVADMKGDCEDVHELHEIALDALTRQHQFAVCLFGRKYPRVSHH